MGINNGRTRNEIQDDMRNVSTRGSSLYHRRILLEYLRRMMDSEWVSVQGWLQGQVGIAYSANAPSFEGISGNMYRSRKLILENSRKYYNKNFKYTYLNCL